MNDAYDPTTQPYDEPLRHVDRAAKCPDCGRWVMIENIAATGFIAKCGRRLINISEVGGNGCERDNDASMLRGMLEIERRISVGRLQEIYRLKEVLRSASRARTQAALGGFGLQAKPLGGQWADISPHQLEWCASEGYAIRAVIHDDGKRPRIDTYML